MGIGPAAGFGLPRAVTWNFPKPGMCSAPVDEHGWIVYN